MRETAWDKRIPTQTHELRYTRLLQLHDLTLAWLETVKSEAPPESPDSRITTSDLQWMIDILTGIVRRSAAPNPDQGKWGLQQFMDDTSPDDVIARLETGVWLTHAHTLNRLRNSYAPIERKTALDNMEQASWRAGRAHAEAIWSHFPQELRYDVGAIFRAALDSPFLGTTEPGGLLIEREYRDGVTVHYPRCPHQSRFAELAPVADELCVMHSHWMSGFAYAIQPRLRIHHRRAGPGGTCSHQWKIGEFGDLPTYS